MSSRLTTNEFIRKSNQKHSQRYCYSETQYTTRQNKITIICPDHGSFKQTAYQHLRGSGCPKCAKEKLASRKRLTTDEFIKRAKQMHGNRYDYSQTKYTNNLVNVDIICQSHGVFSQLPNNHLKGSNCPTCSKLSSISKKTYTTKTFTDKAALIHGGKYCYSDVKYVSSSTKVSIICESHGEFTQRPASHLEGSGCPKCAGNIMNTTTFVEKARLVHGDTYNYSTVNYVNNTTPVKIMCSKHRSFTQRPASHLEGSGCPKCGLEISATSSLLTTKEYVIKAIATHNAKYDYTSVKYTGTSNPITITCPEHGDFEQLASNHLLGHGCKTCATENHVGFYDYNRLTTDPDLIDLSGTCYLMKFTGSGETFYKVGITTRLSKRFYKHVTGYDIDNIAQVDTSLLNAFILEQNILYVYSLQKYKPMHQFGGHTECLTLTSEDVNSIIAIFAETVHGASLIPLFETG